MRENEIRRQIGLARVLSKLGYCSRSRAAELIRAGRVTLSGKIVRNPEMPVSGKKSQIAVDGKEVDSQPKVYLMLNKPRGVVTTASDEKGRETIYDVLSAGFSTVKNDLTGETLPWLAPVGRLDKASEGLLLLTNDSEWGARIAAPEMHLNKTYHVQVGIVVEEDFIEALIRGVKTKDGEVLRAKQTHCLRAGPKNCWLEIALDEGKNRHIRRMMESMGVEVLRLVRVGIGSLQLGDLPKGKHRSLTTDEKRMLDRSLRDKV
ncbi:MAG TPA: pseudouridine synthase [Candidatus Sulfotelmatobacter sp.]|nr:pseudouridine synthase [Candidatus Sulfotelmatobacter sp.]